MWAGLTVVWRLLPMVGDVWWGEGLGWRSWWLFGGLRGWAGAGCREATWCARWCCLLTRCLRLCLCLCHCTADHEAPGRDSEGVGGGRRGHGADEQGGRLGWECACVCACGVGMVPCVVMDCGMMVGGVQRRSARGCIQVVGQCEAKHSSCSCCTCTLNSYKQPVGIACSP